MGQRVIQDQNRGWQRPLDRRARRAEGSILAFDSRDDAKAKLAELFPVLVKIEQYAGDKRSRVVQVFRADAECKDGTPPA